MPKAIIAIGVKPDAENEHGIPVPTPDGFTPPDGVEDGETFQVMADVRMDGDKLILEKLDGKDVSPRQEGPEDEDEEVEPADKPSPMGLWKKFSDSQK